MRPAAALRSDITAQDIARLTSTLAVEDAWQARDVVRCDIQAPSWCAARGAKDDGAQQWPCDGRPPPPQAAAQKCFIRWAWPSVRRVLRFAASLGACRRSCCAAPGWPCPARPRPPSRAPPLARALRALTRPVLTGKLPLLHVPARLVTLLMAAKSLCARVPTAAAAPRARSARSCMVRGCARRGARRRWRVERRECGSWCRWQ
jgi:hypothetical protein